MTFPAAHNYFTVHWSPTGITTEGGQFGLRFNGPLITNQADVDGFAAATKTWWQNASTNLQPNYNLNFVKVARIGTNGLYVPGAPIWQGNVI